MRNNPLLYDPEPVGQDRQLQLAASVKWGNAPERLAWLQDQGMGIAFAPDPENLSGMQDHLGPYVRDEIPIRLHGFFPGYEIGDVDSGRAKQALDLHFQAVEAAARVIGPTVMTCHIGLTRGIEIDPSRAVENLGRLVRKARPQGVSVALENLKHGPTSDPRIFRRWAEQADAAVTLDLGHALSSEAVAQGRWTLNDILDGIGKRLVEVHYYEKETDRHYRPETMEVLGPVVDRLLLTGCRWWTIELESRADILHTRDLTLSYLAA